MQGTAARTYISSGTFNAAFLLLAVLVPLDALRLGLNPVLIGFLAALPGALQLPLRILSGPLSDAWGERTVLLLTFFLSTLAGLLALVIPNPIWGLVLAQLAVGAARGLFWTAAQSYVSRLPGQRVLNLGRFTSFAKGGALVGIATAGTLATLLGIGLSFGISAMLSLISLFLASSLITLRRTIAPGTLAQALKELPRAAVHPFIILNGLVSILCALPQALTQSFYPVYLVHQGLPVSLASMITALQSLGMIVAGFFAAAAIRRMGSHGVVTLSAALLAASLLATASGLLILVALAIFLAGIAAGWLNVAFISAVAEHSTDANRGTNLGVTQVYFVLSMIMTPILAGALASEIGLAAAFTGEGVLVTIIGTAIWIFARRIPERFIKPATSQTP